MKNTRNNSVKTRRRIKEEESNMYVANNADLKVAYEELLFGKMIRS